MSSRLPSPVWDRRWVSSEHLVEPWLVEDRWWLGGRCDSFLDTGTMVFGQKKIFLIDRKPPKSEGDLSRTAVKAEARVGSVLSCL